jgi:hypothetical protein
MLLIEKESHSVRVSGQPWCVPHQPSGLVNRHGELTEVVRGHLNNECRSRFTNAVEPGDTLHGKHFLDCTGETASTVPFRRTPRTKSDPVKKDLRQAK